MDRTAMRRVITAMRSSPLRPYPDADPAFAWVGDNHAVFRVPSAWLPKAFPPDAEQEKASGFRRTLGLIAAATVAVNEVGSQETGRGGLSLSFHGHGLSRWFDPTLFAPLGARGERAIYSYALDPVAMGPLVVRDGKTLIALIMPQVIPEAPKKAAV